jgi:prephenate dehydrogenase
MPAVGDMLSAVATYAPHCPLTDVVSVKAPVARAVAERDLSARFVGGHPMAGTSESGWAATDAGLFADTAWVVASDDGADPAVWQAVAELALRCGAAVVPAGSGEHDQAVARISHLPHVLAEALALTGTASGGLALSLAAGSFRDGTRVAGTAPALVRAMCEANADALLAALDESLDVLSEARSALRERRSIEALTTSGHAARLSYERATRWEISDVVPGAPGWLELLRDAGRAGGVINALSAIAPVHTARGTIS